MKKHYRWDKKIFARNMAILMIILFCVWATISYCEILIKNTNLEGGAKYSKWNLWTMAIDSED